MIHRLLRRLSLWRSQRATVIAARKVVAAIYDNDGLIGLGITGPLVAPLLDLCAAIDHLDGVDEDEEDHISDPEAAYPENDEYDLRAEINGWHYRR